MIRVVCWFLSCHTNPGFLLFVALLLEQILACTTCCKNTCWKTSILGKTRYIIHPSIIRPSVPTSLPHFHSLGAIKHPSVFLSVLPFDPSIFRFSLRLSIRPLSPIHFHPFTHSLTHSLARPLARSPACPLARSPARPLACYVRTLPKTYIQYGIFFTKHVKFKVLIFSSSQNNKRRTCPKSRRSL